MQPRRQASTPAIDPAAHRSRTPDEIMPRQDQATPHAITIHEPADTGKDYGARLPIIVGLLDSRWILHSLPHSIRRQSLQKNIGILPPELPANSKFSCRDHEQAAALQPTQRSISTPRRKARSNRTNENGPTQQMLHRPVDDHAFIDRRRSRRRAVSISGRAWRAASGAAHSA